jgi:hypothetical protein
VDRRAGLGPAAAGDRVHAGGAVVRVHGGAGWAGGAGSVSVHLQPRVVLRIFIEVPGLCVYNQRGARVGRLRRVRGMGVTRGSV